MTTDTRNIFQPQYEQYHDKGYAGQGPALPGMPYKLDRGFSSSNGLKPGHGVVFDRAASDNKHWEFATASTRQDIIGIVGYEQSNRNVNSDGEQQFDDGKAMKVWTEGPVWVMAGEAIKPFDLITFDERTTGDTPLKWIRYQIADAADASAVADVDERIDTFRDSMQKRTIYALTEATGANQLIIARLSPVINR